jgi:transglutaminase/protease-like cytokinesis protein 3
MPPEAEADVGEVARYIAEREADPLQRLKALHDWVSDRIRYDAEAYFTRRLPPQDPRTVMRTRTAVCAGYAKLLKELGRSAGLEIVYVTGDARGVASGLSGEGHAWNAAKIDGRWYLIDATWDAGSLDGRAFVKQYRTDYFMTPPEVFGIDHFPDKPEWQLRERPLGRGEFLRQPAMRPGFYAHGLELLEPTRSQTDVRQAIVVRVRNPRGLFFLATFEPLGGGTSARCDVVNGPEASMRCAFPAPGAYRVILFGNRERYGTFGMLGQLDVNNSS